MKIDIFIYKDLSQTNNVLLELYNIKPGNPEFSVLEDTQYYLTT